MLHDLKGKKVLDIGCGVGTITVLFGDAQSVVGLDQSESMIKQAREDYGDRKNIEFLLGDAINFSYENQFDLIFSSFCLHWVENKDQVFKNIKNALKPNGVFLLIMVIRNEILAQARGKVTALPAWKKYLGNTLDSTVFAKERDYAKYARKNGLEVELFRIDKAIQYFDTEDDFVAFLRNVTPNLNKIPKALRDDFVRRVAKEYAKAIPLEKERQYKIEWGCVKLKGRKLVQESTSTQHPTV